MAEGRLFVGNLSYQWGNDELKDAFDHIGDGVAKAEVVRDRETERSKGFGFVTMKKASDAQIAIQDMNNTSQGGRSITVSEAHAKEGGGRRDSGGGGRRERY